MSNLSSRVKNNRSDAESGLLGSSSDDSEKPVVYKDKNVGSFFAHWWQEIFCCILTLVALAAIIITLAIHQGRPLPDWPHQISVNTLISVFLVVLKGAMMLPLAEGISQFKWRWYHNARPLKDLSVFDLASRGPWGAARLLWTLRGRHLVASFGAVVIVLALAIDPFAQQVIRYYTCDQQLGGGSSSSAASIPRTNYYSIGGGHIGAGETSLDLSMQKAIYSGNGDFLQSAGGSYSSTPDSGYLGAILMVMQRLADSCSDSDSCLTTDYWAAGCSLYPCLRQYGGAIKNAKLQEKVLSIVPMQEYLTTGSNLPNFTTIQTSCLTDAQRATLNSTEIASDWIIGNDFPLAPKKCAYGLGYAAENGMETFFEEFFTGTVSGPYPQSVSGGWQQILFNAGQATLSTTNATFERIAEAMTIHMRQNGDSSNSEPAIGIVHTTNTCVGVRWQWLILPLAEVFFAILFTSLSIIESSRHVWKSSPLPLIYLGLDSDSKERQSVVHTLGDMERDARETKVRLSQTDEGWKFVPGE
ncbi:MAG: hypothetical protein M1834_002851 [Cirrosporium novae-zelandiae]|nr:MAG: hypothetical protein M1834_002851 [Cirrosporium novae-zelandiae]